MKRFTNIRTFLFITFLIIMSISIKVWTSSRDKNPVDVQEIVALKKAPDINSDDFEKYEFVIDQVDPVSTKVFTETLTSDVDTIQTGVVPEFVRLRITENDNIKTVVVPEFVRLRTILTSSQENLDTESEEGFTQYDSDKELVDSELNQLIRVETSPKYHSLVLPPLEIIPVPSGIIWGIYDPFGNFEESDRIDMEQIYINWLELPGYTYREVANVLNSDRVPFVSIEPYPWEGHEFDPTWITEGSYDLHIVGHCSALNMDQEIYVRFAHEMDLFSEHGLFPWIGQDPDQMIEAFQHFATLCRSVAPNVKIVWSPAGHANLASFYPGEGYVDAIGLTSLSNQLVNGRENADGAFNDLFGTRYDRVSGYGKPVFIVEFGAAQKELDSTYVEDYFKEAYSSFQDYPLLRGVILFNLWQKDDAWGEGVNPNFQVDPLEFPPQGR